MQCRVFALVEWVPFLLTGQWVCHTGKDQGNILGFKRKSRIYGGIWGKRRCSWLNLLSSLIYALCRTLTYRMTSPHGLGSSPTATAEKSKGTVRNDKRHMDSGRSGWVGKVPPRFWGEGGAQWELSPATSDYHVVFDVRWEPGSLHQNQDDAPRVLDRWHRDGGCCGHQDISYISTEREHW